MAFFTRPNLWLFSFIFAAVFLAGCTQTPLAPSPTPTISVEVTPIVLPTEVPTAAPTFNPTVVATPTPAPSPTPQPPANYSMSDTVGAYFAALNAQNYAGAYALVADAFKTEDADAKTLDAFTAKAKALYPSKVTVVSVTQANGTTRRWLFEYELGGKLHDSYMLLDAENGYNRIRVAWNTPGLYYNSNAALNYTLEETRTFAQDAFNAFMADYLTTAYPASPQLNLTLAEAHETDASVVYYQGDQTYQFGTNGPGRLQLRLYVKVNEDPYSIVKTIDGRSVYFNNQLAMGEWSEQFALQCSNGRYTLFGNLEYYFAHYVQNPGVQTASQRVAQGLIKGCPP